MSKRKSHRTSNSNHSHYQPPKHQYTLSAKPLTFARPIRLPLLSSLPSVTLKTFEDRRTSHPLGKNRPAFALPKSAGRIVVKDNPGRTKPTYPGAQTKARLSFADPTRVAICVRRKTRREVLHALKLTRKGAGSSKRLTSYSGVSC